MALKSAREYRGVFDEYQRARRRWSYRAAQSVESLGRRAYQRGVRDAARAVARFCLPGVFLVWYFLYVVLAAFAPHFMTIKVVGNTNVGFIFGLPQVVSTFTIATSYVRFADNNLDPISERIRARPERAAR